MSGDPRNIEPVGAVEGQMSLDMALKEAYKSGYYDAQGNPKQPMNFTAQMMDKLFHCNLPKTKEEFDEYYNMLNIVMHALPRIPNINQFEYEDLRRDFEDLQDQSASEGLERVVAADSIKLLFRLRAAVSRGDVPLPGITGVSAIISSRQTQEMHVKMPQQEKQSKGIFGFLHREK